MSGKERLEIDCYGHTKEEYAELIKDAKAALSLYKFRLKKFKAWKVYVESQEKEVIKYKDKLYELAEKGGKEAVKS
jgi:hypothetical protein